jgi:four helix bundle protein
VSQADELQARTDAFADLSLKFVEGLPNTDRARRLAGQYQDASTSAAANYRAARRARSHAEFTAKIGIVSEEADESVFWLKRMLNANIRSTTAPIEPLLTEAEELAGSSAHHIARRRVAVDAATVSEPKQCEDR